MPGQQTTITCYMKSRLQPQYRWLFVWVGLSTGCVAQLDDWAATNGAEPSGVGVVAEPSQPEGNSNVPGTSFSPSQPPEVEQPASCRNGVRDEGETGVDCGGAMCWPCAVDWSCEVDEDCQSRICSGVCLALSCGNGVADNTETDLDCGGPCAPCDDGLGCYSDGDCESGVCNGGECVTPHCDDAVLNGRETDVDCGGSECRACGNGSDCTVNGDCVSGICADGTCVEQGCADGQLNGSETDVDCGGTDCTACPGDGRCAVAVDCASGVCLATSGGVRRCSDARCDDGVHNGRETDVDCGGADCGACPDGAQCYTRIDCSSSVCDRIAGTCSVPTCDDEVENGDEADVDCGGTCPSCDDGEACDADEDCLSGLCLEQQCRAGTCSDARQNQGESDVDCGGSCPGCGLGLTCSVNTDCRSGACDEVCRPGAAGKPCDGDQECASGACIDGTCAQAGAGASCESGAECRSGFCSSQNSCGKGAVGTPCVVNDDCATMICGANACAASRFGIATDGGADTSVVAFKTRLQANASDPPRQWRDLALLYFFTPEGHDDFVSRYYDGPDFAVWDARFLAVSVDGTHWAMIWRATATNAGTIPTTTTTFDYQLRNDPWITFDLTNDYSFRTGGFGANERVVVCQRVEGRWVHTQGSSPTAFPAPCELVVDSCAQTTAFCDPLARTQ